MPILEYNLLATKAKDLRRSQETLHLLKADPSIARHLQVEYGFIHLAHVDGKYRCLGRLQFKYLDLFTKPCVVEHWQVTGGRETNIISDIRGTLLQPYGLNLHLRFANIDLYEMLGQTPPIGQLHGTIAT